MDNDSWKTVLKSQFTAAIDTLENAINACPDELWFDSSKYHQFWYVASHTIFWLDYYLTESTETFKPPEPFGMEEIDPAGVIPDPPYSKDQLLVYLEHGRNKCVAAIDSVKFDTGKKTYRVGKVEISRVELFLYVLRHVQHHAAQMNLILRQEANLSSPWVFRGKESR